MEKKLFDIKRELDFARRQEELEEDGIFIYFPEECIDVFFLHTLVTFRKNFIQSSSFWSHFNCYLGRNQCMASSLPPIFFCVEEITLRKGLFSCGLSMACAYHHKKYELSIEMLTLWRQKIT